MQHYYNIVRYLICKADEDGKGTLTFNELSRECDCTEDEVWQHLQYLQKEFSWEFTYLSNGNYQYQLSLF